MQRFLNAWIQGTDVVQYTPAGLAWSNAWGSLRYTANAALIAVIYGRHINGARRERGLQRPRAMRRSGRAMRRSGRAIRRSLWRMACQPMLPIYLAKYMETYLANTCRWGPCRSRQVLLLCGMQALARRWPWSCGACGRGGRARGRFGRRSGGGRR